MNNEKTPKYKWAKSIGTLMIGIATIIVSIFISGAANRITRTQMMLSDEQVKSQMELTRIIADNQLEVTERRNASDVQLKTIEIFLELIKSETLREKEMAVRLLTILDRDMALALALSIATNKSEDRTILQTVTNFRFSYIK